MAENPGGLWGVRCLFRHGGSLYEERVVLLRAETFETAIEQAEAEAARYVADLTTREDPTEYLGLAQAYMLADERAEGPWEVFSLIRESDLPPTEYLDRFFDTGSELQGEI